MTKKSEVPDFVQGLLDATSSKGEKSHLGTDTFWGTELLPCGIAAIDHALGGGLARGRIHEFYGDYSSGKTFLLYQFLARNQQLGGYSMLIETEGAYDPDFFRARGGIPEKLVLSSSEVDTVEQVFRKLQQAVEHAIEMRKTTPDYNLAIGWDSIAATGTKHLQKEGLDKRDMSRAFSMSQGCAWLTMAVKRSGACVIACNQLRDKIGGYGGSITPGGHAWNFHCTQRVELKFRGGRRSSTIKTKEEIEIGRHITGKVEKSKIASPWGEFVVPIYTEDNYAHPVFKDCRTKKGIDAEEALLDYYKTGKFFLDENNSERVVTVNESGWHQLHPSIDPSGKKFYASQWLEKLEEFPQLRGIFGLCAQKEATE